ncbi:UvrABC system C protein, putative [Actinidia rufa]|uniref:UvrABC system C protein, putative n=1 Tax=Actinidia rufa TaxID=165716 RepID=A0A7J0EVP4_9ERIC|nr:UvrABC system C protein, putative [Actinidia rufa]
MATTALSSLSLPFPPPNHRRRHHSPSSSLSFPLLTRRTTTNLSISPISRNPPSLVVFAGGGGGTGGTGGGGGGGDGGSGEEGDAGERNKSEAIMAVAEAGRSLDSLPKDLAAAIEAGKVPGSIVCRYFELEKSPLFRWLLQFGGFKERLLADDLFLAKVAMECGVGIFTKV